MISYAPLWETLKEKNISTYKLINTFEISSQTIHSLKHNKGISIYTLEKLCLILDCTPNDIVQIIKE